MPRPEADADLPKKARDLLETIVDTKPEAPAQEAEPAVQAIELRKRLTVRDELFGAHEVVFKKGDIVRGEKAQRLFALHSADVVVIR